MTRTRRFATVALTVGVIALSSAASAFAQEAPQLERAWLAGQSRGPAGSTDSKPSLRWTGPLGLLLMLGVAGGYFYLKRRKRHLVGIPSNIQVVGSARIGPKAHAVVTTVGGKVLVLGVTDHHVSKLATLDDAREFAGAASAKSLSVRQNAAAEAVAATQDAGELHPVPASVAARVAVAETDHPGPDVAHAQTEYPARASTSQIIPGVPRRFRDMLCDVLSRPPKPVSTPPVGTAPAAPPTGFSTRPGEPESPAEQIANVTVDFFERGRELEKETLRQRDDARNAELPPPLEGQVAGLRRWRPGGSQ